MTDDKELIARLRDFEKVTVGDARDAADRIEALIAERDKRGDAWRFRADIAEVKLAKAVEAGVDVAASLNAAISLLERGGKKAAASDKMFAQMLVDYNTSLDRFRATIAEIKGESHE